MSCRLLAINVEIISNVIISIVVVTFSAASGLTKNVYNTGNSCPCRFYLPKPREETLPASPLPPLPTLPTLATTGHEAEESTVLAGGSGEKNRNL